LPRSSRGDTFDWDVVLHEFGHYVAANLGIDTSKGGLHGWEDNLGQTYGLDAGFNSLGVRALRPGSR